SPTPTVTHAFANPGAAAITRTVKLTVTGAESGTSAPATQPLTVQGTPVVTTQTNTTPTPTTTTTTATTPPGPPPTVTFPKGVLPKSVSVDAKGTAAIKVTCPAGGAACTGKVVLTIKVKQKVKGRTKTVTVKLGTA